MARYHEKKAVPRAHAFRARAGLRQCDAAYPLRTHGCYRLAVQKGTAVRKPANGQQWKVACPDRFWRTFGSVFFLFLVNHSVCEVFLVIKDSSAEFSSQKALLKFWKSVKFIQRKVSWKIFQRYFALLKKIRSRISFPVYQIKKLASQ